MNNPNHQSDPAQRARLRWRARRGLLENDLIVQKFLDNHELELNDEDVESLTLLLEMTDNDLLDVLLGRRAPEEEYDQPGVRKIVQMMQSL